MSVIKQPYAHRLCLSGVESRRLLDTFRDFGVRHIQVSYYYLRRVFSDPLEFEEYTKSFHTVIIDSGTVYGNVKNEDQKDELLRDYASYLAALNKHSYTAAVYERGYDLDKILPDEALIYPLDDIRSVFDNDLASVFRNIKYVGVSNKECSAGGGENLIPIFAHASKTGAQVHAFGTGSRKILSKYPFYSANSSSWRSGSRYLNTYIYEGPGRGLRLYQPTDKKDPVKTSKEVRAIRRRQSNLVKVRNPNIYPLVDWKEAEEGDSWEVDKGNLAQWLMFVQDLELLPHNKYFLTDRERQEINLRKQELLSNAHTPDDNVRREPDPSPTDSDNDSDSDITEAEVVGGEIVPYEEENPLDTLAKEKALDKPKQGRAIEVDERMRAVRNCDYCILAGRCPKYSPGSACAYGLDPQDPSYDPDNLDHHINTDAADLLAIQKDRILQLYLEEKMDASGANKDLTNNLKIYMEMVQLFKESTDNRDSVDIKVKGTGALDMFKRKD